MTIRCNLALRCNSPVPIIQVCLRWIPILMSSNWRAIGGMVDAIVLMQAHDPALAAAFASIVDLAARIDHQAATLSKHDR